MTENPAADPEPEDTPPPALGPGGAGDARDECGRVGDNAVPSFSDSSPKDANAEPPRHEPEPNVEHSTSNVQHRSPDRGPNPPPEAPPPVPLRFHGRTEEYFRIWIVNTLLTVLTLGVFFAWAKVRKRRYLRGCTELMGHRFDYRADPLRLSIGHVVVLILFLGYSVFGVVYPWLRYGVLALAVVLLPWIVVRSFTFNAHNTVYRGIRFRFNASLSAATSVYLFEPLLIAITLGIYYPAWQRSKRAYAVNNHRFGDAYFRFTATNGHFYLAYLAAGAIVFGAALLGGILSALLLRVEGGHAVKVIQLLPFFVVYGFGFYLGRALIYGMLFNHIWNHTQVDDHRFQANLEVGRWVGLQLTNLGAIIISLGLLYPWAVVRAQRYAASRLSFVPAGPLDSIQSLGGKGGSATGDMAAEFIGIDFGL